MVLFRIKELVHDKQPILRLNSKSIDLILRLACFVLARVELVQVALGAPVNLERDEVRSFPKEEPIQNGRVVLRAYQRHFQVKLSKKPALLLEPVLRAELFLIFHVTPCLVRSLPRDQRLKVPDIHVQVIVLQGITGVIVEEGNSEIIVGQVKLDLLLRLHEVQQSLGSL